MNLQTLFKTQAELDKKIVEEKGLQGQDLLDKKILALQVELGELANEWRGFKYWSNDQEPRTKVSDFALWVKNGGEVDEEGKPTNCFKNPLLEEYVDCLHFILSIGLELEKLYGFEMIVNIMNENHSNDIVNQFNNVFSSVSSIYMSIDDKYYENEDIKGIYEELFEWFIHLGKRLGFAWEEVEQAYMDKNKINHQRQEEGY